MTGTPGPSHTSSLLIFPNPLLPRGSHPSSSLRRSRCASSRQKPRTRVTTLPPLSVFFGLSVPLLGLHVRTHITEHVQICFCKRKDVLLYATRPLLHITATPPTLEQGKKGISPWRAGFHSKTHEGKRSSHTPMSGEQRHAALPKAMGTKLAFPAGVRGPPPSDLVHQGWINVWALLLETGGEKEQSSTGPGCLQKWDPYHWDRLLVANNIGSPRTKTRKKIHMLCVLSKSWPISREASPSSEKVPLEQKVFSSLQSNSAYCGVWLQSTTDKTSVRCFTTLDQIEYQVCRYIAWWYSYPLQPAPPSLPFLSTLPPHTYTHTQVQQATDRKGNKNQDITTHP
ncbi:hypothetical protein QBC38DRAFT_141231 [Podospora fimiseda]|uniref:Uncharacterized protein n=1 Tax=Podospora fimiseda TaxID=252190 RepID=A0AAN7BSN6_9PEZI|nr:hypothetical protein QBC38DRAFT_141231 [Podospora fimiseda]